jgi:starch synthase
MGKKKNLRITLLTNEFPPHIYGGAGVHVEYLSKELAAIEERRHIINIFCFGEQNENYRNKIVKGMHLDFDFPSRDYHQRKLLDPLLRNILMTGSAVEPDIVHCHTWYTLLAGCLIKHIYNIPMVITSHSLEPHRPWKTEQLGSSYRASTWLEKIAYQSADGIISVSRSMKRAVHDTYQVPDKKIRMIPNGIDINQYKPTFDPSILNLYNINPDKPFILFVGRITRQKGIIHFIKAIKYILPGIQVVICADAPDTEEIAKEMKDKLKEARKKTQNKIIWIKKFVPRKHVIALYSHASVFVCPSIYEPFGIINLESMSCKTPVIASDVGGIPEVVVHGDTGFLVHFERADTDNYEPRYPERFSKDIAAAVNDLFRSPEKMQLMSKNARKRVEQYFSWEKVAEQTLAFYKELISRS